MKKTIFLYLALAFLLPSAIAFNCNSLSGGDFYVCNSIQSADLSSMEKDLLISDIFNKNKTTPNFDFVYQWNTNLKITSPSDGKTYSSGIIRNAWIETISLMPSVIEDNILYVPKSGKIRTEYNYQYILPSAKQKKDCKTIYSLVQNTATLTIYLNGKPIGNSKLNSFNLNEDNANFISRLDIAVRYRIKHYRLDDGSCRYYDSDYITDTLTLTDSLSAKLYKSQLDSSFKITDKYFNVTKGVLTADNFTKLILSFYNSQYQNSRYVYSLNYSLPYYVLTLKAEPIEYENSNNIYVGKNKNNFTFTIKDTSNCKITLFDHFDFITKLCDLSFNEINFSIRTDKINYYENDTIKVYITPENALVNITYANQSRLAKNYTEFRAVLYENKINAKLNNKEINILINATKKEDITFLYNISVLSFLGYFFFKAAKVYFLTFPI